MTPDAKRILELLDAGHTPVAILRETGYRKGTVYAVLRRERPDRARAPRTRTSPIPGQIRALWAAGIPPVRIASLLSISRVYAYRYCKR